MGYRIEADEPVGVAIRRVGREQTEKALDELANNNKSIEWRVHQLRKRCKRIRALVRLVQPGFAEFKSSNRRFRDIAREVSAERDARVMADLVRKLANRQDLDEPLVRWFSLRCEIAEELAQPVLDRAAQTLVQASVEIERWPVTELSGEDVIHGMTKTLKRAHKGLRNVRDSGEVGDYHDCRKHCKYHWYHLQLLRDLFDTSDRLRRFGKLGELTGDSHDRSVLLGQLNALPEFLKRNMCVQRVAVEAIRERRELRRKALGMCERLFEEKPEDFAAVVEREWARNRDVADDRRDPDDRAATLSIA